MNRPEVHLRWCDIVATADVCKKALEKGEEGGGFSVTATDNIIMLGPGPAPGHVLRQYHIRHSRTQQDEAAECAAPSGEWALSR